MARRDLPCARSGRRATLYGEQHVGALQQTRYVETMHVEYCSACNMLIDLSRINTAALDLVHAFAMTDHMLRRRRCSSRITYRRCTTKYILFTRIYFSSWDT